MLDQAVNNPVLINTNLIAPNQPVDLYTNCIDYTPVKPDYGYSSSHDKKIIGYTRQLVFETYIDGNGVNHGLTDVDYYTSLSGHFLSVQRCQPEPACSDYVIGMPKAA